MEKRKRGHGEGSIRKRSDGTWEARISVGYNPDGTLKRRSLYGKTQSEVREKMRAALNDVSDGEYIEPSKMTVSIWLDTWLTDYKKLTIKPTTYVNYYSRINHHIKPAIGKHKLQDVRNDMLQRMFNSFSKKELAPETVKGIYNIVKAAFAQAHDNGLIPKNVAKKITLPKIEKKRVRVFTVDEQKRFIDAAKATYQGEVFILDLGTGLRIGEILALSWADIDFNEGTLSVNRTLNITKDYDDIESQWQKTFGTPKTESSIRKVPLLPNLQTMLKAIRSEQESLKVRLEGGYEDNNLVFATRLGRPLDPRNMQRTFASILKKAEIEKGIHIHCLRHSFATRGLENGIELKVMQELLGHSSINMTADLYTHVLPEKKQASIMKLVDTIDI